MKIYNLCASEFQSNRKTSFLPHTDVDVQLNCDSPLEWNQRGMTEHEGGTPATT
jgi:hypothetical protein